MRSLNQDGSLQSAPEASVFSNHADLGPLQPRGLTFRKLGIVLPVGTASFENWLVESPNVVFDPATQQFVMVYTGYSTNAGAAGNASVGMATSLDGINWTRTGTPVIQGTSNAGDPDQYGTTGPSLWIEKGTYYLFYIGLDAAGYEGGTKRMMLATATSISGPWTRQGVIVSPSGTGWRSTAVYNRSIVKHPNGTYYMFFNAYGNGGFERIGYATAANITGTWTVDDVNSPLIDVGTSGAWDSQIAGDPSVYRVGDTWYMAYYGYNGTNGQDGAAFTTNASFPLGWAKHPQNPLLKIGVAGSYDDTHAHKPCIAPMPGGMYHYYTAVGNGQSTTAMKSIALAIDAPGAAAAVRLNPPPIVDTFNRPADSATDLGVATTGQQWRNDAGVTRNVSSHAEPMTLVSGQSVASLDAGFADGKTTIRILNPASAGASIGLICRMIDANNFIWADIDTTGISIVKRVAGSDTLLLAKVARTIAASDLVTVSCYANTITVTHNNVWIGTVQDNFAVTGTRRGLRFYAGGGATVDDFAATPF